jgi:hypothetical protein
MKEFFDEDEEDREMMETLRGSKKGTIVGGEGLLVGTVLIEQSETTVSKISSFGTDDYMKRLQFGGNIYNEDDLADSATEVAKKQLWLVCKFVAKGDKQMMMYRGPLCELMIEYTCEFKPIYEDIFASESNREMYWNVAAPIVRQVLFRKRSAATTAIRKYFMGKKKVLLTMLCCVCVELSCVALCAACCAEGLLFSKYSVWKN